MNDGLLIEVFDGRHDAVFELLFRSDTDMAQDRASEREKLEEFDDLATAVAIPD